MDVDDVSSHILLTPAFPENWEVDPGLLIVCLFGGRGGVTSGCLSCEEPLVALVWIHSFIRGFQMMIF